MAGILPQSTERVTLQTLRSQHPPRAKAANQYSQLKDLAEEDPNQGDSQSRLSLKSEQEQTGGSDHKQI